MIAVVDYGMGNLRSVVKALEKVGGQCTLTSDPEVVEQADKVVVPGVGSFGQAMTEIRSRRLETPIKNAIASKKPFLGICLGLQVLFESSEESSEAKGLGIIAGVVKRFDFKHSSKKLRIPHIGWNEIEPKKEKKTFFDKIKKPSFFYFVHSFYGCPDDSEVVAATCSYGVEFACAIAKDNIWAVQFHPEKSQDDGLQLLTNFVRRTC